MMMMMITHNVFWFDRGRRRASTMQPRLLHNAGALAEFEISVHSLLLLLLLYYYYYYMHITKT